MSDQFPRVSEDVNMMLRVVPLLLLLGLVGCGGSSSHSDFVTPPAGPPTIASLSPTSGVAGAAVTISGSNFGTERGSNTVTFNGQAASIANWSDTGIVAKVPSGATSGDVVVTVASQTSNGIKFNVVTLPTGSIALSNFGFQCGPGDAADCEGSGKGVIAWPTSQAQPGLLRLHDAGTQWANMDQGNGIYNWTNLDQWLDLIAAHQPVEVSQVFTWVPCWLAQPTNLAGCQAAAPPTAPSGSNIPPPDLGTGPQGSSIAFNNFVSAFVSHCNPNNHCVKDLIRYYEMWNEWDLSFHWTGSMADVYNLVAYPAVSIIKQTVPNAVILMPSSTPDSDTGLTYQCDFQNWLSYEDNHGYISDWIDWHVYLTAGDNATNSPEDQWSKYNANFLSIQAGGVVSGCLGGTPSSRWKNIPWANTETNFNGAPPPGLNYTCPAAQYSAADCTGQIVRWQLLHDSNGASGVFWYKWNETIGGNPQYEPAYNSMMQYLAGGKFNGPCGFTAAGGATTWTCAFTENGGKQALWVWTPNEAGTSFSVPAGFVDYLDPTATPGTAPTSVTAGQSITIGPVPFMLEQQ